MRFATRAIHAGQAPDPATGATVVPIYQTSTYTQEGIGQNKGYVYSRSANPTRTALEECVASLEGAEHGLAFASGLAATVSTMSLLSPGDHVVEYMGGHSDVIGGVLSPYNERLYEEIKFHQNAAGAVQGPFDCWVVLRGLKTLAVRMRQHEENALAVAEFLERHPEVASVYCPGLKSHPQHELAKRQMSSFSGMVSFTLRSLPRTSSCFITVYCSCIRRVSGLSDGSYLWEPP